MTERIPEGFNRLQLPAAGFIDAHGPLYGKAEDERFVMGFRVEARHCDLRGRCHGGMLATLADMLLARGSSVQAKLDTFLLTVSLACDYLEPVAVGMWLEGRLDVLRVTRTLVFSQGVLTAAERPVLRVSATLKRPHASTT